MECTWATALGQPLGESLPTVSVVPDDGSDAPAPAPVLVEVAPPTCEARGILTRDAAVAFERTIGLFNALLLGSTPLLAHVMSHPRLSEWVRGILLLCPNMDIQRVFGSALYQIAKVVVDMSVSNKLVVLKGAHARTFASTSDLVPSSLLSVLGGELPRTKLLSVLLSFLPRIAATPDNVKSYFLTMQYLCDDDLEAFKKARAAPPPLSPEDQYSLDHAIPADALAMRLVRMLVSRPMVEVGLRSTPFLCTSLRPRSRCDNHAISTLCFVLRVQVQGSTKEDQVLSGLLHLLTAILKQCTHLKAEVGTKAKSALG